MCWETLRKFAELMHVLMRDQECASGAPIATLIFEGEKLIEVTVSYVPQTSLQSVEGRKER